MFKLGDKYRIIRKVNSNVFDEIFEIDSIETTNRLARNRDPQPPFYTIVFLRQDNGIDFSLCVEFNNGTWSDPKDLDSSSVDWKIIKV